MYVIKRLILNILRGLGVKKSIYALIIFAIILIGYNRAYSQQLKYEFKGIFKTQDILLNYCDNCYLDLPIEFLETKLVLAVSTNSDKEFLSALQKASKANNWELKKEKNSLSAEPIQNTGNLVYISCQTGEPINVPKYIYYYAIKADSLKCAKEYAQQLKNDSIALYKQNITDSLANLPPIDFKDYELQYYSFSKSFSDKMGMEWQNVLSAGNLTTIPSFYDDWKFWAVENQDTSFNFRSLNFTLDSVINVDWGQEEQTLSRTYNDNGVITQEYEWRKYGLIVTISRDSRRVKMSYTFRDKENAVSILQGQVVGKENDTLCLQGIYNVNRETSSGIPFLSRIPLIGYIFSTKNIVVDSRIFNLFLVPKKFAKEIKK